jgi:hypothetical protein
MCLWVVVWSGLVMLSIIIHWSDHRRVAGTEAASRSRLEPSGLL